MNNSTTPDCIDPDAPRTSCCVCGKTVYTCEREEPVDNDYRCPAHPNECGLNDGRWVCSEKCWNAACLQIDAQDVLNNILPGTHVLLADGKRIPRFAEWSVAELHVFNVPVGQDSFCVSQILKELHKNLLGEDELVLVYPHDVNDTDKYYSDIVLKETGNGT